MEQRTSRGDSTNDMRVKKVTASIVVASICLGILIISALIANERTDRKAVTQNAQYTSQVVVNSFSDHLARSLDTADAFTKTIAFEFQKSPDTFDLERILHAGLVPASAARQITITDSDGVTTQTSTPGAHPIGFVRKGEDLPAADATMHFLRKRVCRMNSTG
jgi:hypothetical protein